MKLSRLAGLGFIAALVACNPTLPPPPPGWNLELRAGTTNIDSSFFQSTKPDPTRSSEDQIRFEQLREAIIKKVPNLGSTLASGFVSNPKATKTNTRETAAYSLSLLMAVSKDSAPPASDLSFIYSGPKGTNDKPVVYPAGKAWIASVLSAPKGNGSYTFSSTLQDGTLAGSVSVNFEDQTQWLPFAMAVSNPNVFGSSMGQYANVFIANWQAVPEAQSYIGLVFDRTDKKYVASFVTNGIRVETQEFNGVQDHTYSLDLIATNIDLTKDDTKPYGTLPATMKSSLSSFYLNSFGGTPGLNLDQTRVNILAKPNQIGEALLKIKNLGTSPLGYKATISGAGLELGAGASGILLNEESRELHVKGTCTGVDLTGVVTITSNDPNNKTKTVPVTLECDFPVTATLELAKLSHNTNVQLMQYSPDGTKLATSDGTDIIVWDAGTGDAIRKITPVNSSYSSNGVVFSFAWHPLSKLLLVGSLNTVNVFDTTTGLSVISSSPSETVQSVDWNADGSQFVIGLIAAVQIYDGSSGGLVKRIEIPAGSNAYPSNMITVSWSKASGKLATVGGDRVTVWDVATGTELNHYVGLSAPYYASIMPSWNAAGDTLAFLINDGKIGIWIVKNANLERSIAIQSSTNTSNTGGNSNVQWIPASSNVAIVLESTSTNSPTTESIGVWDALTGNIQTQFSIPNVVIGYPPTFKVLAWTSNGQSVLTQTGTTAVSWNANNGSKQTEFGFVPGTISSVHFNTDGTKLLVGANSNYDSRGTLSLMDVPSGKTLQNLMTNQNIRQVDWRKDAEQVIGVSSGSGIVQSYVPGTWSLLNAVEGYAPSAYSPDGTKIAVSLYDTKIRILDAKNGAVLQTITVENISGPYPVQGFVWSPDSSKIAAVGSNSPSKLKVFDAVTGQLIWGKDLNNLYVFSQGLMWSPDGKRIVFGTTFYDANTGEIVEVFDLNSPNGVPLPIAFSPDSRYLLTINNSNFLELRSSSSGRKILSIRAIPVPISIGTFQKYVVDWNSQSNRIAISDRQSSVYIYKFSQP